jgi:NMD protein affecting ribosome stability and mRNA decay
MAVCRECGKKVSFMDLNEGRCSDCYFKKAPVSPADMERARAEQREAEEISTVILSTEAAPDLAVAQRLDIVTDRKSVV